MPRLCRPPPQSPCLGLGAGLASLEGVGWGTPVPFARGKQGRGEGGEQGLPCLSNTFCLILLWLWVEAQAGLTEQAFTAHHLRARRPRSGCCRCLSGGEGADSVLQATSQGREGARVFSSSSEGTDPTRGLHPQDYIQASPPPRNIPWGLGFGSWILRDTSAQPMHLVFPFIAPLKEPASGSSGDPPTGLHFRFHTLAPSPPLSADFNFCGVFIFCYLYPEASRNVYFK